jgi:formate C-acetyltransferase
MTPRTSKLRQKSLDTRPSISHERAVLLTDFYQMNYGRYSIPVMRAKAFYHLCKHKTIYIGEEELIVGERGPKPKNCPTYPELTCHRVEDLEILNSRPKTSYQVEQETLRIYREKIIPYWQGRSMRDHIFGHMSEESGRRPMTPVSLLSSWSSVRRGIPFWMAKYTAKGCWIS